MQQLRSDFGEKCVSTKQQMEPPIASDGERESSSQLQPPSTSRTVRAVVTITNHYQTTLRRSSCLPTHREVPTSDEAAETDRRTPHLEAPIDCSRGLPPQSSHSCVNTNTVPRVARCRWMRCSPSEYADLKKQGLRSCASERGELFSP